MRTVQLHPFSLLAGAVTLISVAACGRTQDNEFTPEDAADILAEIRETYSTYDSYRDEGEVRTVFSQDDGREWAVEKSFKTAFVRGAGFRFEFREEGRDANWYVIWTNDTGTHSWWTIKPQVREWESVSQAVEVAAGVSSLSSYWAPTLLMWKPTNAHPDLLAELSIVGEERLGRLRCYKIETQVATLWFDRKELLLRRVFSAKRFDGFSTEATTTYRPEVNVKITDEELGFEPPSK